MLLVKFNAWEQSFAEHVEVCRKALTPGLCFGVTIAYLPHTSHFSPLFDLQSVRHAEMVQLRRSQYAQAVNIGVFFTAPLLAAAGIFAVHTMALGHTLDAATAFATLAWTNVLGRSLVVLPRGAASLSEALVAVARIQRLLSLREVDGTTSSIKGEGAAKHHHVVGNPLTKSRGSPNGDASLAIEVEFAALVVVLACVVVALPHYTAKRRSPPHPSLPGSRRLFTPPDRSHCCRRSCCWSTGEQGPSPRPDAARPGCAGSHRRAMGCCWPCWVRQDDLAERHAG